MKTIKINIKDAVDQMGKPKPWIFKNIKRESVLGSNKYLYSGTLQDPIGETKKLKVMAYDARKLAKVVKNYMLNHI